MKPFIPLTSRIVSLPIDNIDTDQIIPARFLKTVSKDGMKMALFHDWRFDEDGIPRPEFVLNQPCADGAQVLLAGNNFGCGSSREHAAWALTQFGFRAVISTSFADIFRHNAFKNALLPITVTPEHHSGLCRCVNQDPNTIVTIDLAAQQLMLPEGRSIEFPIDPFSKQCLLEGVDELGYILQYESAIAAFERRM